MAFATSNVRPHNAGSLNVLTADWTSAYGDNNGTVTVGGSRVYFASFSALDATTGELTQVPWTASTTNGITTLTVYPHDAVASGRLIVFYV